MRRYLAIILFVVLAPAWAQDPFSDDKFVNHWMTYYYVNKDVAHVGNYLHWLMTSGVLDKHDASEPAIAFVATIFAENPDRVHGWATGEPFTGKVKDVVERALWLSGHADIIGTAFHETPDYANSKPVSLMELPLKTPGAFDMMWGAFLASGNTAYPARLIDVLDESVTFTDNKLLEMAYRKSADWSLLSNMRQHELIYRMVAREAKKRSGPVGENLKAKLATLDGERAQMPNCDGEFCGVLVLISEANLKEFDKPWDQGPQLLELDKAKPGDKIAVKVCFSRMALADDLSANVTYDAKIVRPDGTLYDGRDSKDIPAFQHKTPVRAMVYDNAGVLMIRFEPQDPRGTYTVEVVLNDNIGGHKLTMSKQITLTD